jgi:hypothetical protein
MQQIRIKQHEKKTPKQQQLNKETAAHVNEMTKEDVALCQLLLSV